MEISKLKNKYIDISKMDVATIEMFQLVDNDWFRFQEALDKQTITLDKEISQDFLYISNDVDIKGKVKSHITSDSVVTIQGEVIGDIQANAVCIKGGILIGNIKANSVVIDGTIVGNCFGKYVEIYDDAVIIGKVEGIIKYTSHEERSSYVK